MASSATTRPRYPPFPEPAAERRATPAGRRSRALRDKDAAEVVPERACLSPNLGRLLLDVGGPLAGAGKPVHVCAMAEGALAGGDVLGFAGPRLLWRGLQRAAIGECDLPRQAADRVDGVQM